jgi:formylglycine-generating enzyme required for sulfatase activity
MRVQAFLFSLFLLFSMPLSAFESRIALVIGNNQYSSVEELKNSANDARDMSQSLEALGFQVETGINVNRREMQRMLEDFGQALNKADVGLFYFAGHGIQVNGKNYLLPVNMELEQENKILNEFVSIDSLLKKMKQASNRVNIIILDACRNNPFVGRKLVTDENEAQNGLAAMLAPIGTYIAFATYPGGAAADGDASSQNGLYTQHLLTHINHPRLAIEKVFKKVRKGVADDTEEFQVPWERSSLIGEFYFTEPKESFGNEQLAATGDYDLEFWRTVEKNPSPAMYQAYLDKFPNGMFASISKELLKNYDQGKLTVRSNVFGDRVLINGEDKGPSRLDLNLAPGEYKIEVEKEGYQTYRSLVQIAPNQNQFLDVTLEPSAEQEDSIKRDNTVGAAERNKQQTQTEQYARVENTVLERAAFSRKNKTKTDVYVDPILDIEFVKVKAGCFKMGSPFLEEGRLPDENEHEVCISKDYMISRYEITQAQWREVMGGNPSFFSGCGKNCPVERVSWNEVKHFIFQLNYKTGESYRLPTEAEWEFAARAGSTQSTYAGDVELLGANNAPALDDIAWYSGNSGVKYLGGKYCEDWDEKQYRAKRCGTHPVGKKKANPLGLHDMIGNVWEWTNDWYGHLSSRKQTDPRGAKAGSMKVVKGGNWKDSLSQNRSAARYGFAPKEKHAHIGFRLVKSL